MKKNLCNDSVDCRIFSYEGNDYEQPPTAMVAGGILSVLYGKVEKNEELYVMPDNLKNYFKRRNFIMKTMFIYEPAMCCESGLCGVGIDPELLRISTVISNLKKQGIKVDRYNLNNFPQEFVKNQDINRLINEWSYFCNIDELYPKVSTLGYKFD